VSWRLFVGCVGALGVLTHRQTRRDPAVWLLLGSSLAGAGAVTVLSHPGSAQWYFLRAADVPMSILAAWGTVLVVMRATRPLVAIVVGVAAAVVAVGATWWWLGPIAESTSRLPTAVLSVALFGVIVLAAALLAAIFAPNGETMRTRVAVATAVVALTAAAGLPAARMAEAALAREAPRATAKTPGAFSSSQVQAAQYIRDHATPDGLVVSNRHCRGRASAGCDVRRFFVAAYSERSVLIEGWAYTQQADALAAVTAGGDPRRTPFWDPPLLALNDRFVTRPDADDARRLYELGVRWVFIDRLVPHAAGFAPYARRRLQNQGATVYQLLPPEAWR
jgi:hypothetical protein